MSQKRTLTEKIVFPTKWFQLVAKSLDSMEEPHYSIRTQDYVAIVPVTSDGQIVLVRQFRPAIEQFTLEIPCGHVETGEAPETAARKELLEETGCTARDISLMGRCSPDTGRMGNQMWCFFASGVSSDGNSRPEAGIELVLYQNDLADLLAEKEFSNALGYATLFLAVAQGRLAFTRSS
jgi:ADP-ribose pyrophosphatase